MSSKQQKRKEQKKAARKKRLAKEKNQRANQARFRFRLDVKVDGKWRPAKRFRSQEQIQAHIDETEKIRLRGDTEIIEGRVVDQDSPFEPQVAHIKPYSPESKGLKDAVKDAKAKASMMDAMKIEIPENSK